MTSHHREQSARPSLSLIAGIRPAPGHPLARGITLQEQESSPEPSDPGVPAAPWMPLYELAGEWGSAATLFAPCRAPLITRAFQAIGVAFLALAHEESAYAHYLLVGTRLRYPAPSVAEGLEQAGVDLHEAFINWTAVGMWLERIATDPLLPACRLDQARSLVTQARIQQERLWSLLLSVQEDYAHLTGQERTEKEVRS